MHKRMIVGTILCLSIINSLSCGHAPIRGESPNASSDIRYEDVDQTQSFGFFDGQDEYYFAQIKVKNDGHLCRFFVGFKNNKMKYSFPSDRLSDLRKIYFKKLNVEEKKKHALSAINRFEKENRICTSEIAERQMHVVEKIEAGIYIVFLLPAFLLSSVTFAAEDTVHMIKDSLLKRRMDQIRLGMTQNGIEELLKRPLIKKELTSYTYYFVDGKGIRLAMYFENGRLNAFVRGYEYKTQHEV